MNDEAVYRTAPATPGLLNTLIKKLSDKIEAIQKILHTGDKESLDQCGEVA